METSKYDSETVRHAVSLLKTIKNVSKVSRMTGISRSVLTSWRDGTRRATDTAVTPVAGATAPTRGNVSQDPTVTRAAKLTDKWDRSTTRSLDIVNRRLEQLDKKLRKGGTVTTDDIRGIKETAWVAGVGTDKLQILTGGATSRVEVAPVVQLHTDARIAVRDMNAIDGEWQEVNGSMEAEVDGQRYVYVAPGQLVPANSLRSDALRAIEKRPSASGDGDSPDAGTMPPPA